MAEMLPRDATAVGRRIHEELLASAQQDSAHPGAFLAFAVDGWARAQAASPGGQDRVDAMHAAWGQAASQGRDGAEGALAGLRAARAGGRPFGVLGHLEGTRAKGAREEARGWVDGAVADLVADGDPSRSVDVLRRMVLIPVEVWQDQASVEGRAAAAAPFPRVLEALDAAGIPRDGAIGRLLSATQAAQADAPVRQVGATLARSLAQSPDVRRALPQVEAALALSLPPDGSMLVDGFVSSMLRRHVDPGVVQRAIVGDMEGVQVMARLHPDAAVQTGQMWAFTAGMATLGHLQMAKARAQVVKEGPRALSPDDLAAQAFAAADACAVEMGGDPRAKVDREGTRGQGQEAAGRAASPFGSPGGGSIPEPPLDPNNPQAIWGRRLMEEAALGARLVPESALGQWAVAVAQGDGFDGRAALRVHTAWGAALESRSPFASPEEAIAALAKARQAGRPLDRAGLSFAGMIDLPRPQDVSESAAPSVAARVLSETLSVVHTAREAEVLGREGGKPLPTDEVLRRADALAARQGCAPDGPLRTTFEAALSFMDKVEVLKKFNPLSAPSPSDPRWEGVFGIASMARAMVETPAIGKQAVALDGALAPHLPKGRIQLDEMHAAFLPFGAESFEVSSAVISKVQQIQGRAFVEPKAASQIGEVVGSYVLRPQKVREGAAQAVSQDARREAFARERNDLRFQMQEIRETTTKIKQERTRRLGGKVTTFER